MLRSVLAVCLLLLMSLARAETAVPVRVATTTLQPLVEVVPVSGSVSTARVATLSAEVEGRVSGLPVEEVTKHRRHIGSCGVGRPHRNASPSGSGDRGKKKRT